MFYFADSPPEFSPPPSAKASGGMSGMYRLEDDEVAQNRIRAQAHVHYVTHFPIPCMDFDDLHDENQRNIFLYGVGNARKKACQKLKTVETMMYEMLREVDEIRILTNEYDSRLNKNELKRKTFHLERKEKFFR